MKEMSQFELMRWTVASSNGNQNIIDQKFEMYNNMKALDDWLDKIEQQQEQIQALINERVLDSYRTY